MNQPTEVHVKVVDHDSVAVDWRGVSTGIEEEPLQGYTVSDSEKYSFSDFLHRGDGDG